MQLLQPKLASLVDSASDAGLSYVTGREPGFARLPGGTGFRYVDSNGRSIREPRILKRIQSLVIPPNWKDVWICRAANGHLQATGRDARNRKQYRYHPRYRAAREETKYEKMILFGRLLPMIRQRVRRDLRLPGLPKEKVLAAVVQLMDLVHIRVGNEEYARQNDSFGLTTMRDRHVKIVGSNLHFEFRGKSGKMHAIDLQDPRLATIVRRCRDLPGYELFQYVDDSGDHVTIDSGMVNRYLREMTQQDITAKDFRTWHGTVHAAERLRAYGKSASEAEAKRNISNAVKEVAERLGNRPATCRKYYIHPIVFDLYVTGKLAGSLAPVKASRKSAGLAPTERCIIQILIAASQAVRPK